jgi:hypothetical protein
MSMPSGMDPIDRLRAADPVHVEDVPDASLARVTANVQEHIMSDNYDPNVRPTRGPLFKYGGLVLGGALALAIVVGNGFGIGGQTPGGSASPTTDPGGAAGGGGAASCMVYDPTTLPMYEVVFDGTVTAVDGDQITFDVNEGWKGAEGSITLTAPATDIALTGPLPEFEVGGRYLVTAFDSTINACGYTLDWDADTAAEWDAAF